MNFGQVFGLLLLLVKAQGVASDCYESAVVTNGDAVASYGDTSITFPSNALTLIGVSNDKLEFELSNEWGGGVVHVGLATDVDTFDCSDGLADGASAILEAKCINGLAEIQVFVSNDANGSGLCSECKHPVDAPDDGVSYTFELACKPVCTPAPTPAPTVALPASVILHKTVKKCGESCFLGDGVTPDEGVESITGLANPSSFKYCYLVENPPGQKDLCGCYLNDALSKSEFTSGMSGGLVAEVNGKMLTDCIPSGESVMIDGPCFESPFVKGALTENTEASVACKPSPSGDAVKDTDPADVGVNVDPTPSPTPGPITPDPTPGPTDHCPDPMDLGETTGSQWGSICGHKGVEVISTTPKFDNALNLEPFLVLPSIKDIFFDINAGSDKYHVSFKAMNPYGDSADMYIRYETEHGFETGPSPGREPICIGDVVGKCESVDDGKVHEAICLDPGRHGLGSGTYALVTVYIADRSQTSFAITDGTDVHECCPDDIGTPAGALVVSYTFQIMCEC